MRSFEAACICVADGAGTLKASARVASTFGAHACLRPQSKCSLAKSFKPRQGQMWQQAVAQILLKTPTLSAVRKLQCVAAYRIVSCILTPF